MVMERSGVTSILSTCSSPCTATQEMYPLIFSASLALFLSRYLTFLSLFASLAAASLACESSRATIVTVLSLFHVTGGLGESLTLISNLGDPTFSLLRIEVSSDQVVSGDFLSFSPCLKSTCLKSTCLKSTCLKSPCLKSSCLNSTCLKSTCLKSTCCSSCTCRSLAMLPRATLTKWAKVDSWVLHRWHVSSLDLDLKAPTTKATSSSSSSLSMGLRTARGKTVQQVLQMFPLKSISLR